MSCSTTYAYWDNPIDIATLTGSSETANFTASQIQTPRLSEYWLTTGTSENLVIDAGMGNTIDAETLIIAGHNLTASATVTLQGNTTDAWGAPAFSVSMSAIWDYAANIFVIDTTAVTTYRYWRLVFSDATNPDGMLKVGRVFLGTGLNIIRGVSDSFVEREIETSQTDFSISGQAYTDPGFKYRLYDLFFPYWTESMRQSIKTMLVTVGKHKPIFLVIDSDNIDKLDVVYCLIISDGNYTYLNGYNWSSTLTFREVF